MTCLCTPTLWLARSNQARWIQPISTEQDLSFTFLALWQSGKAFHLSNPVKPFQNLIILDFSGPSDFVNNPSFLKHSSPLALPPLRPLRHTFFAHLSFFFLTPAILSFSYSSSHFTDLQESSYPFPWLWPTTYMPMMFKPFFLCWILVLCIQCLYWKTLSRYSWIAPGCQRQNSSPLLLNFTPLPTQPSYPSSCIPCFSKGTTIYHECKTGNWVSLKSMFDQLNPQITLHLFSHTCCFCLVTKLCLTLCNHMGCSPPGSSVHGISQARILEWVNIFSSRGSSWPRDWTCVPCISTLILYHCASWEHNIRLSLFLL